MIGLKKTRAQDNTKNERRWPRGGRNLVLLGVASVLVALATTGVSLAIYHNSGDIYLDRSRPGFLPDEEEIEDEGEKTEEDYVFDKSGKLTVEVIEQYLENLEMEVRAVDAYEEPFGVDVLSDEYLGIPTAEN